MAYDQKNNPASPDAVPLFNNNILKFWNWFNTVWGCGDWMTWHKAMKAKYGKEHADGTFLLNWDDLATGSSAIDCRSFNTAFRNYMRQEKLLDALYSGVGFIAKPLGVGTDVLSSAGNTVSNVAKGIEGASKVAKIVVPAMLIGTLVVGGLWAYKKFLKK